MIFNLEIYIQNYPDTTFLNLFHMHRASFWQVVEYWLVLVEKIIGCRARQDDLQHPYTYQQTAVGAVLAYTWRTINNLPE